MIELRARDGGMRAVILPEHGGRLHQLLVPVGGTHEPLLWSPDDPRAYRERPTRGGCFPMAPWPNRIANGRFIWDGREYVVPTDGRPHANHGRVMQREWHVAEADEDACVLECALDAGWPWPGIVRQTFALRENSIELRMSVDSDERFPLGVGWHPWFRCDAAGGTATRLTLPATERYVLEDNLPTGDIVPVEGAFDLRGGRDINELRLDDCYRGLKGDVVIDWGVGQLRMELQAVTPGSEPHVQVYTQAQAFCVEPQTCAPDAFNLHAGGVDRSGVLTSERVEGAPPTFATTWWWEQG